MGHWEDKKTVNNLITTLNILGTYSQVRILWVNAHANTEGNNKAYHIANCSALPVEAIKADTNVEEITDIPAPYTYLKSQTEEGLRKLYSG